MIAQLRDVLSAGQSTQVAQEDEELRLPGRKQFVQTHATAAERFKDEARRSLTDLER